MAALGGGLREFRTQNQALDQMGAMRSQSSVLTVGETPERIETAAVSPSCFRDPGNEAGAGTIFRSR